MIFTAIAVAMGLSALIGASTGVATGEGMISGALGGLNIVSNLVGAVGQLAKGNMSAASMHLLGVSDITIGRVDAGKEALFQEIDPKDFNPIENIRLTDEENMEAMSTDILVSGATLLGAGLISKYGAGIASALGSNAMAFQMGSQIGSFKGAMTEGFRDISQNMGDSYIINPLFGQSGSSSRFDTDRDPLESSIIGAEVVEDK